MYNKKQNILHIVPHLGGGVGRVLLNYLEKAKKDSVLKHKLVCLEYANENVLNKVKKIGIELADKMFDKTKQLLKMIAEADIVLIHWWNHPLLYDFLVRTKLPPCRLIIWSHVSGFNAPHVFTKKILQYPDQFVFTTPVSFTAQEVKKITTKQKKSLRVVWSTAGVEYVKSVKQKKHSGFNIGYIGTVDYAKLHPNFINICNQINIPNVKFIVCGGSQEKEIKAEAEKLGIADKFKFTGQVSDITKYLSIFDVFGYLLNREHYGTCDQVLAESMAAGVVPVTLNNKMEKYIIKNNETGIVVKNENGYIRAIEKLYEDGSLRKLLAKNAKNYALETFSLAKMVKEWELLFKEVLTVSKTIKKWNFAKKISNISAKDVFLESLGSYGKDFAFCCKAKCKVDKEKAIKRIIKLNDSVLWQSNTKGTVHHYFSFFPSDRHLSIWSKIMKGA